MIVKEKNWNTFERNALKVVLVTDLFDKIGIALKHRIKNGEDISTNDKLIDSMIQRVDDFFYTMVASKNINSSLLPLRLKDANRFYIFSITPLPTGGLLLSFVAKLAGDIDPVILDLIY